MAVKTQLFHIVVCDICGAELDEANEAWAWDISRKAALSHIADYPDWTEVEGGVVCPRTDPIHDEARGGDSPVLLRPTRDAMSVSFDDANWVADVLGATVISTEEAA